MVDTKVIKKFPETNKMFCNISESEIRLTKNGTHVMDDHVNVYSAWKKTTYEIIWRIISKSEVAEFISDYNLDLEKEKLKKITHYKY